jgi:hypothetical protein
LPRDAVRDLLGITRALYRAARAAGDTRDVVALAQIGAELRRALDLSKGDAGSMGHRSAWSWAEQATAKLGVLVADKGSALAPAVKATAGRLRRGG